MSQERRKFVRTFSVDALVLELGNQIYRGAQCKNISIGGFCTLIKGKVSKGHLGTVTISHRCGEDLVSLFSGFRIVWQQRVNEEGQEVETLVGIEFVDVDNENYEKLVQIVNFLLQTN